jgi:intracellular septation protein
MAGAAAKIDRRQLAIRFATEFGPALVFVAGYFTAGLATGTLIFVAATAVVVAWSWFDQHHVPYIPLAMLALAAVFGGLTVLRDDASFIQIRATVLNAASAAALVFGLTTGRLYLKGALQNGFQLTDKAWRSLTVRMAIYLMAMAVLNEVVRRGFSTDLWAWFKAAMPVLNAGFLAANWPLIRRHLVAPEKDD